MVLLAAAATAWSADDREVVRIALDRVPAELVDQMDPCAIDREADGVYAVFFLEPEQLARLEVDHERIGTLSDYVGQFLPNKTMRRKAIASLTRLGFRRAGIRPGRGDDGGTGAAAGVSLEFDEYHNLDEGVEFLHDLAEAYPDITQLLSIGQSIEGRDIWALRITDQPELIEPEEERILFTGVTHAREWATHEMMLYMAQYLVTGYDSDPRVREIVDNSEVWLVPVVNPDGYEFTWTSNRMWRKNRRDNSGICEGVDLNRNYSHGWGGNGSSGSTCSEIYRGSAPASEPETQAIENLLADQMFAIAISYHSYGQMVLYPWGETLYVTPQSYPSLRAIGKKYAKLILESHGTQYTAGQGSYTIYVVSGDFDDHAYGAQGALSFTPEMRPATSALGGFLLPENQILPNNQESMVAALWLMENVAGAVEMSNAFSESLIESPGIGSLMFSLPFTPVNQSPVRSLGFDPFFQDQFQSWLADYQHQPPYWGALNVDFEACGAGGGYVLENTADTLNWSLSLNTYKVLPNVFEDGAEVMLSTVEPGVNVVGIPAAEQPVLLRNVSIIERVLRPVGDGNIAIEEDVLSERIALEDADSASPWIDWRWTYVDSQGVEHVSHPGGDGGASLYVQPFRSYFVDVEVPSWNLPSSVSSVYLLRFPNSTADCNENGISDADDIASGTSGDCNANGLPDECESLGDADEDGDLDLLDFAAFRECAGGSGVALGPGCERMDLDGDEDVDLLDFACLMSRFTGDCGVIITEQPEGDFVCPGDVAVMQVEIDGVDAEYQWYLNGQVFPGATESTLVIDPVSQFAAGKYRVRIADGCGEIVSVAADLDVPLPPEVLSHPEPVHDCLGSFAEFFVAADGLPPLSYQWQLDGEDIVGATEDSHQIAAFGPEHLGAYRCEIVDGCESSSFSDLAVLSSDDPTYNLQPEGGESCIGDNLFPYVEVTGDPDYQWFKDDEALPDATTFFLSILDATLQDSGTYHVVATNDCGESTSDEAIITIIDCDGAP